MIIARTEAVSAHTSDASVSDDATPDTLLEFASELEMGDAPASLHTQPLTLEDVDAIIAPLPIRPNVRRPRPRVRYAYGPRPATRSRLTSEWRAQRASSLEPRAMERAWIPKELVLVASRAITQSWPLMTSGSRTVLPATFACGIVLGAIGMLLVSERARTSSADPASSPARLGALSSQGEGPSQGEGRFTAANPPPRTDDSVARVSSGSAVVSKATPTSNQRMQPAAPDSDDDARTPTARPVVYRGSLRLDSQPRGARVFLNGREMGTTPLDLTNLAVGSRAVRLELDGYQLWSSSVQVSTSRRSSVTATLSPEVEQPASVRLGVEGLDGRPAVRPLLNMSVP